MLNTASMHENCKTILAYCLSTGLHPGCKEEALVGTNEQPPFAAGIFQNTTFTFTMLQGYSTDFTHEDQSGHYDKCHLACEDGCPTTSVSLEEF